MPKGEGRGSDMGHPFHKILRLGVGGLAMIDRLHTRVAGLGCLGAVGASRQWMMLRDAGARQGAVTHFWVGGTPSDPPCTERQTAQLGTDRWFSKQSMTV